MNTNKSKSRAETAGKPKAEAQAAAAPEQAEVPAPEAFLEEAKREPKRKLISDHSDTIRTLREEKKFTFRAIAEWFCERGIETDRGAVYRAYLLSMKIQSFEELVEEEQAVRDMEPD